jgi:transcriptional regulator with XRE-family HTH domain
MKSLRTLRTEAGMTQADLAYKAGLSAGIISQIEVGRVPSPRMSTMVALAQALGSDIATIAEAVKLSGPSGADAQLS